MKNKKLFHLLMLLLPTTLIAQSVDPFTGDLNYQLPLITLPSPNGGGIPISAQYTSGVMVDQSSSEIGLGWSINSNFAITRSVVNIPDDVQKLNLPSWGASFIGKSGMLRQIGVDSVSLYEKDIVKYTKRIPEEATFIQPGFDKYYVNCSGVSGEIKPYTFKFNDLETTTVNQESPIKFKNTEKINFHYSGDFQGKLTSRHYPDITNSGTAIRFPETEVSSSTLPFESTIGSTSLFNNMTYSEEENKNRMIGKRYVEYFTNRQINDHFKTTSPTILKGLSAGRFIDYTTDHNRESFELDGLGAFRVTDESGTVYHFSLPVYINSTIEGSIPLNNDYSEQNNTILESCSNTWGPSLQQFKSPIDGTTGYFITDVTNKNTVIEVKEVLKYAYAWLLVAITGPDYDDVNNNEVVDAGDKGYWVSYDWKKWTSNFIERTPQYGFSYSYRPSKSELSEGRHVDSILNNEWDICNIYEKLSEKTGVYKSVDQEVYYLDKISSSTHSVLFVREVRNDEHSSTTKYDEKFEEDYVVKDASSTDVELSFLSNADSMRYNSPTGVLHDKDWRTNGGGYGSCVTVKPWNYQKIELSFEEFSGFTGLNDIEIYEGTNTNPDYIYSNTNPPPAKLTINASSFMMCASDNVQANTFKIRWRGTDPANSNKPIPQLSIKRLLLIRNDKEPSLPRLSEYNKDLNYVNSEKSQWSNVSNAYNIGVFYTEAWYQTFSSLIDPIVLRNVEFVQDYSLVSAYYKNIHTSTGGATSKSNNPTRIHSLITTPENTQTGKLTLNSILFKEMNGEQIMPSIDFSYNVTVSADNPSYNPKNADYWGYYKSDATSKGFGGYQTSTSKDNIDAWSLRKITSPMGGTIGFTYEADQYAKVVDKETVRGASRIYPIENVFWQSSSVNSNVTETTWKVYWEDESSDLWDNNAVSNVTRSVVIPVEDENSWSSVLINDDTYTLTNNTSGYDLINNARIYGTANGYSTVANQKVYRGNGYVRFDLPTTTNVYGGGIRVKSMSTMNGTQDNYLVDYTYAGGICSSEPDRFSEEQYKVVGGVNQYKRPLIGFDNDMHSLSSQVGYSKITIKNKGQNSNNTNNIGESVISYINEPNGIDNYKPYTKTDYFFSTENDLFPDTTIIVDVVNKFSALWGRESESIVKDFAGNTISKTKTNYIIDDKGFITELTNLTKNKRLGDGCEAPGGCLYVWTNNTISIDRHFQSRVESQINYEKNAKTSTVVTEYDEITGNSTEMENYDINNVKSVSMSSPLWKQIPAYGSKAVDYDNLNFLGVNYWSKSIPNFSLSNGNDFSSFVYSTWKLDRPFRNTEAENPTNDIEGLKFPIIKKAYRWNGPLGVYGLYDNAEVVAFNESSPNAKWLYDTENILFDEFGKLLCSKTFNNRYSASKYIFNGEYQSASCSNSNYGSFTFSGFEHLLEFDPNPPSVQYPKKSEGEIELPISQDKIVSTVGSVIPHTGKQMLKLAADEQAVYKALHYTAVTDESTELQAGRAYRISVWVHSSSPSTAKLQFQLNAAATPVSVSKNSSTGIQIGDWIQLNLDVEIPDNYTSPADDDYTVISMVGGTSGTSYFDDFSFRCADCSLSANIVDRETGFVTSSINNNNFASFYEYDNGGRLLREYIEIPGVGKKLQKQYKYNYFRMNE